MTRMRSTVSLIALALASAACGESNATTDRVSANTAPAYQAATLAGDTVRLLDLRGSTVLLNVWATWCVPCREEMPALQELHQTLSGSGLRVVAVSIDGRSAGSEIQSFLNEHNITFMVLHDPEERVTRMFRTIGVPQTFLIGRDGSIMQRWIGQIHPTAPEIRAAIDKALVTATAEKS